MVEYVEDVRMLRTGRVPDEDGLERLLLPQNDDEERELLQAADAVRRENLGDGVHLRGLIEFSNICARSCHYCGIRAGQGGVQRYRLTPDEVVATAQEAVSLGYRTVVLQSGEDSWFGPELITEIVSRIRALGDVAITLSVGERLREDYKAWRDAGADRYLMRFETSDARLYTALHPGMSYTERFRCLADLRELGYQLGSGFLVGLPGQTARILAKDLLTLKALNVEMAGIGPFLPAPGTPLAGAPKADPHLCYRAIALARLLLPWAHLPATTAIGSLEPAGRLKALCVGANVVMPNMTPQPYRSLYQLYPNKICLDDTAAHCRGCIEGQILSLGRHVADGPGHGRLSY